MDVKELIILNSKKCECGHEYTLADFTKLEKLEDAHGFYGNLVKYYSKSKCPDCGKEVVLLLRQKGQTWEIMNTATISTPEVQEITPEIVTSTGETEEDLKGTASEQTEIGNEEEKDLTGDFICPECKKICKNKSGLAAHMRTHQN